MNNLKDNHFPQRGHQDGNHVRKWFLSANASMLFALVKCSYFLYLPEPYSDLMTVTQYILELIYCCYYYYLHSHMLFFFHLLFEYLFI